MISMVIKNIRKSCYLSQQDFADKLNVSFSTVNRWETGKTTPNFKAMQKIDAFCKAKGIEFDISKEILED